MATFIPSNWVETQDMTLLMFSKFCAEMRKVRARCVTMELLITNGRVPNMLLPYQIVSTAGQGDMKDT